MSVLTDKCSQFTFSRSFGLNLLNVVVRFGRSRHTFMSCFPSRSGERLGKILLLVVESFYKGSFSWNLRIPGPKVVVVVDFFGFSLLGVSGTLLRWMNIVNSITI